MRREFHLRAALNLAIAIALTVTIIPAQARQQGPVQAIESTGPRTMTMWEFHEGGVAPSKTDRMQNSFAIGLIDQGLCSGVMLSPHIFMTAAHCGGPAHTSNVRFFRIDEDSATPGDLAQRQSQPYQARTFPWTVFNSATGGGDVQLWWLDNGSDGVPPGIKYGYLDIDPVAVMIGDEAYSFWVNPVDNFRGNKVSSTILYSPGKALDHFIHPGFDGPMTNYDIENRGGASGSPVFAQRNNQIIGITSCGNDDVRCATDADHFLNLFDASCNTFGSRNWVIDAIEYDWMMTRPIRDFRTIGFDTPFKRSEWRQEVVPGSGGGGLIINEGNLARQNHRVGSPLEYGPVYAGSNLQGDGKYARAQL